MPPVALRRLGTPMEPGEKRQPPHRSGAPWSSKFPSDRRDLRGVRPGAAAESAATPEGAWEVTDAPFVSSARRCALGGAGGAGGGGGRPGRGEIGRPLLPPR